MQAFYDHKPATIEAVGDGSYKYRWNIVEIVPEVTDENINELHLSQWRCDEVTVWGPLTSNKITEAVIGELWTNNDEQKLVNEYNSAQLGVLEEAEAEAKIAAYKKFLTARTAVKKHIDEDCKAEGIA